MIRIQAHPCETYEYNVYEIVSLVHYPYPSFPNFANKKGKKLMTIFYSIVNR